MGRKYPYPIFPACPASSKALARQSTLERLLIPPLVCVFTLARPIEPLPLDVTGIFHLAASYGSPRKQTQR